MAGGKDNEGILEHKGDHFTPRPLQTNATLNRPVGETYGELATATAFTFRKAARRQLLAVSLDMTRPATRLRRNGAWSEAEAGKWPLSRLTGHWSPQGRPLNENEAQ